MSAKNYLFGMVLVLGTASLASAQALRNADGPAELPSASYTERQYVDSRGCVFVRAGFDGNTVWVPRVSRDRELLCGFTPSVTASDTVPGDLATTVVEEAAADSTQATLVKAGTARPVAQASAITDAPRPVLRSDARLSSDAPAVRGFRPAWSDGRLNANRGPRSASGDRQMAAIWTETVPRKPVPSPAAKTVSASVVVVETGFVPRSLLSELSVSTRNPSAGAAVVVEEFFVQLGAFGVADNVRRSLALLEAGGFPAATRPSSIAGKGLQTVLAGPFANRFELQNALSFVRRSGYSDAFVRK